MIGQKHLLGIIDKTIQNNELSRFIIIVGPEGSGKKELAKYICTESNFFWCYEPDNKIDTVRKVIADCYKVTQPTCYVFTDVESMSLIGRNAMLKITEEPPNNTYFIMTTTNINTILSTIQSRATVYNMEPYTQKEILDYAYDIQTTVPEQIVKELCETPGDVEVLLKQGGEDLYNFVEKVIDHIDTVSVANALKVSENIAFKGEKDKYDLKLFLRAFKSICGVRMQQAVLDKDTEAKEKYTSGIKTVTDVLKNLNITGINKGALFDIFILNIRREWA